MAFLAVETNNRELIASGEIEREHDGNTGYWVAASGVVEYVGLPKGSIKKLIGKELSWEDDPVEI